MVEAVRHIHDASKAPYVGPRVHAELAARGLPCCVNTVATPMRRDGVAAKARRKFRRTTDSGHGLPVAENLLARSLEPGATDRAWSADVAYIPTREGRLYLAAIENLHRRQVVDLSIRERSDSSLGDESPREFETIG